ncbi:UNVERIFIED_CONTAM: hypothetical protein FKN15_076002 [Acipenser sinensis]
MDRNALAELLQALESRRDAEERRREERYTALIERGRWKSVSSEGGGAMAPELSDPDDTLTEALLAHELPTDLPWFLKFNPKIFKKKQKNGSSPKPSCPYCCCAVGSKDRSVSVWVSEVRETGLRSSTDQ